jgi:hypothetical protein
MVSGNGEAIPRTDKYIPQLLALHPSLWHNIGMSRWFLFLITIAFGAAAGLYYGWMVKPVENLVASPASLRADWKTDIVLMTAEAYHSEGDLAMAFRRLAILGDGTPEESLAKAIRFAASINPPYAEADMALMQALQLAIQNDDSIRGSSSP